MSLTYKSNITTIRIELLGIYYGLVSRLAASIERFQFFSLRILKRTGTFRISVAAHLRYSFEEPIEESVLECSWCFQKRKRVEKRHTPHSHLSSSLRTVDGPSRPRID